METIIGREPELAKLQKYMDSGRGEFVAVYGRRRVGKTFLVRRFFKDKFDFYVTGIIGGARDEQMEAFNDALVRYGYVGDKVKTWPEAFRCLGELLQRKQRKGRRQVVFIDELPCFDTLNSRFVHALDHFWNSRGAWMDNLFFVVCGSATSWMIKNIIDNHGGLHNRITHEIHLHPFSLRQSELFLRNMGVMWNRLAVVQLYMAMGGIPYYLGMVDKTLSVQENIDMLFFSDDAEMRKEYNRLFKSLFKEPDNYMALIALLTERRDGMTRKEVAATTQFRDNGHLSDMLQNLVSCDFLRLYNNGVKQTNGIYQVVDFYTLFHNKFCRRRTTDEHFWRNHINTSVQNTWYGLAFERICLCHFRSIIKALRLDAIHTEFYSWRSSKSTPAAQIDMVIDRADGIITVCEIKYSKDEYVMTKKEYSNINHRVGIFVEETKTRKGVQTVLMTTFGLRQNEYSDISHTTITIDDLFNN